MKHVLLVDDDPDILASLRILLEENYRVTTAENGAVALRLMTDSPFDVVVLDLMMPVLDGVELVQEMQTRGIATPVIIASAASNLDYWKRKLRTADAISKPFDIDALIAKIERVGGDTAGGELGSPPGSPPNRVLA
ncbi:MAG: response regulator [Planctomycetes bacterium]|nr:response regulator [Planctomycetota bacterium]